MPDDEPEPILELPDEPDRVADNDEWAFREADRLVARLPPRTGGKDQRTESEVFDQPTLMILHKLLVHGVLHLCGYDHETDDGEMNRLELKLRRKLLGKD